VIPDNNGAGAAHTITITGAPADFTITGVPSWLTVLPSASGTTPAALDLDFDSTGLAIQDLALAARLAQLADQQAKGVQRLAQLVLRLQKQSACTPFQRPVQRAAPPPCPRTLEQRRRGLVPGFDASLAESLVQPMPKIIFLRGSCRLSVSVMEVADQVAAAAQEAALPVAVHADRGRKWPV